MNIACFLSYQDCINTYFYLNLMSFLSSVHFVSYHLVDFVTLPLEYEEAGIPKPEVVHPTSRLSEKI